MTTHAFLWSDGTIEDLGSLGGPGSIGNAIDEHGRVVGQSSTSSNEKHAFLFRKGRLLDLNDVAPAADGFVYVKAFGINKAGTIIGFAVNAFTARPFVLVRDSADENDD